QRGNANLDRWLARTSRLLTSASAKTGVKAPSSGTNRCWCCDDCRAAGCEHTGDGAGTTDDIAQAVRAGDSRNRGLNRRVERIEVVHELGGFDRERIRNIENIFIAHFE